MPVPTHGPFCKTWLYPTDCWYCGDPIHVLQCTCGSAVLLNVVGWPWDQHDCSASGTLGRSGLKGWAAVDALRASGVTINPEVMAKVFPPVAAKPELKQPDQPTKAMLPESGEIVDVLAVVRDLRVQTKKTEKLKGMSELGAKLLKLPSGEFWQVTLIVNHEQPQLSYTCLLPVKVGLPKSVKDKMIFAKLEAKVAGEHAVWLITDAHLI